MGATLLGGELRSLVALNDTVDRLRCKRCVYSSAKRLPCSRKAPAPPLLFSPRFRFRRAGSTDSAPRRRKAIFKAGDGSDGQGSGGAPDVEPLRAIVGRAVFHSQLARSAPLAPRRAALAFAEAAARVALWPTLPPASRRRLTVSARASRRTGPSSPTPATTSPGPAGSAPLPSPGRVQFPGRIAESHPCPATAGGGRHHRFRALASDDCRGVTCAHSR